MAFKRISENDMLGKGNVGKPDTPGVSTSEMQRIMDELPREVIAPAFNELSGQLEANTASADIGANAPDGITPDPAPAENSPAKLQSVLQGIVNKITDHIADQVKHVTSEERTLWNNASNDRHTHDNKSILDGITSSLVGNWNAAFAHISDAVRHITENERTNWNDKYTKSETDKAINERVVEIGSSDMTKAVYDPETRNLPYIPKIDAEALTLGKNVVLSGTPVSIAYAGAQRIAAITAYGETPQGGTTEAPVALTGISSVTVNDDVTDLPIPRPLRRVGDVKDKCVTRQDYESAEKLVVTYNVGFVELDGTENWVQGTGSNAGYLQAPVLKNTNESHLAVSSIAPFKYQFSGNCVFVTNNKVTFGSALGSAYTVDTWKAYLAAQKSAGTPVQVAYQLATPEVYATDPIDFDNAAGPLTVMTGGEVEVRMTELVGSRSDVSNNTVAFSEASQDADIQTEETLSTLFGKIKKRLSVITTTFAKLSNLAYGNEVDTGLTWLDGKKIYRKTAKITPSQYAVLEEGDPVTYTATIENWMVGINEICMLQGMLVNPEGYYLPLGAKRNGNNDYGGYIAASIENNIVKLTIGTGARPLAASNISHFTVICEYTKI